MAQRRNGRHSTQADVARLAGVSVATVSYVVSGRRDRQNAATPEVIARVTHAMRRLDYTPRRAGRVLARNRTDLVAVVAYTPFNPWALDLITEVEEVAAARGLGMVILRYGHTDKALERVESQLADGLADAAVVLGAPSFSARRLQRIGARVPVLVAGDWYRPRGFDVMVQHEAAAVRIAVDHLAGLGVRRPAYVGGPIWGPVRRRVDAFVEAFREHGYPAESIVVAERQGSAMSGFVDSHEIATELLDRPARQRPDAIVAHSDRAAISTMWAATQLGISIPDQLRVIGTGNIPEGTAITPALTTIGTESTAYRPVLERLLDRIEEPELPARTLTVPWRLILRDTA